MMKNLRSLHKFTHWFFGPFGEENSRRLGVSKHFKAVAPAKMSGTIDDPFDMYLKKLRKIFPNFPQKN